MAYWSLDDEVQTHDFILRWHKEKIILLPVINGNKILVRQFKGIQFLDIDEHFGIQEPVGDVYQNTESIDLAIVPGTAFDKAGNRMGRGKAFYDDFFTTIHAYKIGICFSFQLVPSVPVDEKDISMDEVIST